ncbi:MAG TPA: site-specific integrase [Chloroflexota bacterium]|jgi:integrase
MSIRKKNKGYEVRVEMAPDSISGKRWTKSQMAPTLADAKRAERRLEQEREESYGHGASRDQLGAYLQHWMEDIIRPYRSRGTFESWESVIRLHILPTRFSRVRLCDLTPDDVQGLVSSWARIGVSGRTQHKFFECLHAALATAVRMGKLTRNPADMVEKPRAEKREPTVWTAEQTRVFLAACEADGHRCCDLLRLMAYTGCRVEELCAAELSHFDAKQRILLVPRGKTKAARRAIPLVPEVVELIETVQRKQVGESDYWDSQARTEHWLFRGPTGHRWYEEKVWYHFNRIRRHCELPYARPHDLRHYFGTAAKRAGIPTVDIAAVMGHSNTAITENIYQHADLPSRFAVVEQVASTLRAAQTHVCPTCGGTGRVPAITAEP